MNNIPLINDALGWVLRSIAELVGGNFAASIFLFTLIINIVLIPLSIKSQKSSVQQARIKPKLDDLKKRYGDDKQKYSAAMQKLYQEENVSMSGGCLPMILRLVLMMCIYGVILSPLAYLMNADSDEIKTVKSSEAVIEILDDKSPTELVIIEAIDSGKLTADKIPDAEKKADQEEVEKVKAAISNISEKVSESDLSFDFIGIDLREKPVFHINIFKNFKLNWLMPVMAFLAQMLSSFLSMLVQKKQNPDAPNMSGMLFTMPLISLFIGFGFPCGVTFYWTCSSLIGGAVQVALQALYGPQKLLARERLKELKKQCDFESGQIKKINSAEAE